MAQDVTYPAECRPMNVCVLPGSVADKTYRERIVMPESPAVRPDVIALASPPRRRRT